MIRRIGLAACALVLLAVTAVAAQQVVTGTVVRIDQPAGVVILDNGQMYQATPQTVFLVNNQPATFSTIAPGTPVVVQYAQPVVVRDGRYIVMQQPVATAPSTVVMAPTPDVRINPNFYEVSGVVRYSDPVRGLIRLDDGRNISVTEDVQVLANGAPAMLSTLAPGTFVVVRSGRPLAFRDNTYYTTAGTATIDPITGTVIRVDQPNLIVLSDWRVIPATSQTIVVTDNRTVPYTALQPGSRVVIYPNGQIGLVGDPAAFPGQAYPEMGLREKELERNSP